MSAGMTRPLIVKVSRVANGAEGLEAAARAVREGRIVAFPTETFYGLGVDIDDVAALGRLFALKGREGTRAVPVVIPSVELLTGLVEEVPEAAWALIRQFWPGPLTLVFEARAGISDLVTGGSGKIGIRVPGEPLTRRWLAMVGRPITATSANRSGAPSPTTADEVLEQLGEGVDLILDGGPTPGGLPSTVLDVTRTPFVVVRAGCLPVDLLKAAGGHV